MRIFFMLVRRVPDVPSPILVEVFDILRSRGFDVQSGIAEDMLAQPDRLVARHDLYVLKSHTELSLSLAGVLHAQGARLLNPYPSCSTTQNKILTAQRLQAAGVSVPRSWVTGDTGLLCELVEETPLIFKPYLGHRGAGIQIARNRDELARVGLGDTPVLAQEYIAGRGEDLKVYVVGDEVFAVRKPFSQSSFTRPGRPCAVTPEVAELARRCGAALGLGLYGLDVIESPRRPFVVDVNYFPGYKGVPGAAPLIAGYIESYAEGTRRLSLPGTLLEIESAGT